MHFKTNLLCIKNAAYTKEIRTAIFADDISIFTARPQDDLPLIKATFDQFKLVSGLQINYNKSDILPPHPLATEIGNNIRTST